MKRKYVAFLIMMAVIGTSCKTDKNSEQPADMFKVTLKCIVPVDDRLCIFYNEDGTTNFDIPPIWAEVKGSTSEQEVVYFLPADVYPTQLRLDFGIKHEQGDVTLKSVTFEYKGKTRSLVGPEIGIFFRADETKCTFDPATGLIKAVEKNGIKQLPSLYPHEKALGPELEKLAPAV